MIPIKNKLKPSATVMINSLAMKKKAVGQRIFNLSAGEPILAPHELVVAGADEAMKAGKTGYPPTMGIPELRAAASDWVNKNYHCDFSVEETLVTCGGKFGLYALARTFLGTGDEAISIAPYWVSYPSLVEMTGAISVEIKTEEKNNWKITAEELCAAITPKTKIIFFNNAANPTGVTYSRVEINALIAVAAEHDILFVSDEVYSGLVYEGEFVSAGSFSEYKNNVVVIQSVSKHFAMTGWRVGIVFGAPEIVNALADLQSQSTTGTSIISQYAAAAAFANGEIVNVRVHAEMLARRDILVQALQQKFSGKIKSPAAGLYIFVALSDLGVEEKDDVKFCEQLLEEGNVALVPGTPFGAPGYVRFSFGAEPGELVAAVEALGNYLNGL